MKPLLFLLISQCVMCLSLITVLFIQIHLIRRVARLELVLIKAGLFRV
jgi:hypothetical protein